MPHVHTLKSCIDNLAMLAAEINLKRLGTYWGFLIGLDNEVTSAFPDAFPCIGRFETKSDSSIDFLGFEPLPLHTMMTIEKVRSRISDVADDSVKVG